MSLPLINPTTFNFNSPAITSLATVQAAYPFGTYSITTTNTMTSASTTGVVNYTADYFASTVPYLTNYGALNGLSPAAACTFNFPAFTPNPSVTEGFTFLTIYDATTGLVVGGLWLGARLLERKRNPTSRNQAVLRGARPASSGLLAAALIAIGFVKPRRRGIGLFNVA